MRCGCREQHTSVLCSQIFDVLDFYGEPVYLCTCVNVYKYVRIISYGSPCLSFTVCKRMLIFLGKVLWEQSAKVDSHKQANLRHLLRETFESLSTVSQISTTHHKRVSFSLFLLLFSTKWENLLCFLGALLPSSLGTVKGTCLNWDSLYPSGPRESLWTSTPQKAPSRECVTSS